MEKLPVVMLKEPIEPFPRYPLPEGYRCTLFHRGEERYWAQIEGEAGEFSNEQAALEHFRIEFAPYIDEFEARSLFLLDPAGEYIGTATAWYSNDFMGRRLGRLHWVGIKPQYQGRGLGKVMVSRALERMQHFHTGAYLTTQTRSSVALKLYLDFGFRPLIRGEQDRRAWGLVAEEWADERFLEKALFHSEENTDNRR
jgi:GNAT superfamily N-acetyltransferase